MTELGTATLWPKLCVFHLPSSHVTITFPVRGFVLQAKAHSVTVLKRLGFRRVSEWEESNGAWRAEFRQGV